MHIQGYREQALQCFLTAENSGDSGRRLELLELARAFMKLADRAQQAGDQEAIWPVDPNANSGIAHQAVG
jgi:hypothetical protein